MSSPLDRRTSLSLSRAGLVGLWDAYVALGEGLWGRSCQINGDYLRRASRHLALSTVRSWSAQQQFQMFIDGYMDYMTELAGIGPVAVALAARELGPPHSGLGASRAGDVLRGPQALWNIEGKPVMLPARIGDASQAWAFYFVSAARAQAHLRERFPAPGGSGWAHHGALFDVIDIGGSTPLGVFGVEYRDCDLGAYIELGIVLFVTPRDDSASPPGQVFLTLAVNEAFTRDAARLIWGFEKTLAEHLSVSYADHLALFAVDPDRYDQGEPTLSVAFPRLGRNRSRDLPFYYYSIPNNSHPNYPPQRTFFSRSGSDEGFQFGGAVELKLGDCSGEGCLCTHDNGHVIGCICQVLRDFDLQFPAANTWSEHMSGELHAPEPCRR